MPMATIATFFSLASAQAACTKLWAHGLDAWIPDQHSAGILGEVAGVRVQVPRADADAARAILSGKQDDGGQRDDGAEGDDPAPRDTHGRGPESEGANGAAERRAADVAPDDARASSGSHGGSRSAADTVFVPAIEARVDRALLGTGASGWSETATPQSGRLREATRRRTAPAAASCGGADTSPLRATGTSGWRSTLRRLRARLRPRRSAD